MIAQWDNTVCEHDKFEKVIYEIVVNNWLINKCLEPVQKITYRHYEQGRTLLLEIKECGRGHDEVIKFAEELLRPFPRSDINEKTLKEWYSLSGDLQRCRRQVRYY